MVRNLSDVATLPGYIGPPNKLPEGSEDEDLEDEDYDPPINDLDTGALVNELMQQSLLPRDVGLAPHEQAYAANTPEGLTCKLSALSAAEPKKAQEGSYRGTQLVLTKVYDLIEQRFMAYTDVTGIEPLLPLAMERKDRKEFFEFTRKGGYPPHLDLDLNKYWADNEEDDDTQKSTLPQNSIFDSTYLYQLGVMMLKLVPDRFTGVGTPANGKKISDVEKYNRDQIKAAEERAKKDKNKTNFAGFPIDDIFNRPNVGQLNDWYSDARFAQQQFTGTNPTTIKRASDTWLDHFVEAAKTPEDAVPKETIEKLIAKDKKSLYIQDYSNFRKSAGFTNLKADIEYHGWFQSHRYGCAAVCLFFLDGKGTLHPLAIVTDWRGSLEASVTIYNRELFKRINLLTGESNQPNMAEKNVDEAQDWPWRYAKTCVQTSDWFQHEVSAHLTRTHLVEEAIIVSANRQFDPNHAVFRILRPHWQKTLALNAAARGTLVPSVILRIVGFNEEQALKFIRTEYQTYNFEQSYVPLDLRSRGFPPEELDSPKFHNYTYARCVNNMWKKIRTYVKNMLTLEYGCGLRRKEIDKKVKNDKSIRKWCTEMRSPDGADLRGFPKIENFEQLIDCVTMCIHIASPQHTAVNYLQDYYQGFVINKPSCLFAQPPRELETLLAYTEQDLLKALPINHPHEWLLSSHVPYLLSFKPDKQKETLKGCIDSALALIHPENPDNPPAKYRVLNKFSQALKETDEEFKNYANEKWDAKDIPYSILNPDYNAVSILI